MSSEFFGKLRQKAKELKVELLALWFACRDPRTPWYAKLWASLVVGYAFSPIDLIPDFIPVLGYLDDIILLPMGIFVAIRLIPDEVLLTSRAKAREWFEQRKAKPKNWLVAMLIILLWVILLLLVCYIVVRRFTASS